MVFLPQGLMSRVGPGRSVLLSLIWLLDLLACPYAGAKSPTPHCRPGPKGQSWPEEKLDGAQLWGMNSAVGPDSDHVTYLHRLQGRYKCIIFSPQPS